MYTQTIQKNLGQQFHIQERQLNHPKISALVVSGNGSVRNFILSPNFSSKLSMVHTHLEKNYTVCRNSIHTIEKLVFQDTTFDSLSVSSLLSTGCNLFINDTHLKFPHLSHTTPGFFL